MAQYANPESSVPTPQNVASVCTNTAQGLATPEAAVKLYVESIKAGDVGCALQAYGVEEKAGAFDFTSLVGWVGVLNPLALQAPPEYPMFVDLNEHRARGEMADATKLFVYGLLTDLDLEGVTTMDSEAKAQALLQALNPARLAPLKIVRIDQPGRFVNDGEKAQGLFKQFAALSGADETVERIALYQLSDQYFWSGFRLGRYGHAWKISEFQATYGGPLRGGAVKTTVADYEAHTPSPASLKAQSDLRAAPLAAETTPLAAKPQSAVPPVADSAHACEKTSASTELSTPERAIRLYVESIAANDLPCALRAYAAHEYAARFDFPAYVAYVYQYSPGIVKAPTEYPMFVELNELRAKAVMAAAVKEFAYGLLSDRDLLTPHPVRSAADTRAFVQALNPVQLAKLKLVRVDAPRDSDINKPSMQAVIKRSPTGKEADEVTERIALYELSGQYFWGGFMLRRYDKTWKIYEFRAGGGPSAPLLPAKTTIAEYQARLE